MRTLVTIGSEFDDGTCQGHGVLGQYLVPGRLDALGAEELLREAVDNFFNRAGVSYIRGAWEDTGGKLNWEDVWEKRHHVTMYFGAYEIERVKSAEGVVCDTRVTVLLDPTECLFPEHWASKMRALDAGRHE